MAMTEIAFTKVALPYGWLGNMSPHPITFNGRLFKSSEAAFQCSRLPHDHPIIEKVMEAKSPFAAKLVAKSVAHDFIVKPCSQEDVDNMELCLRAKIEQHTNLRTELKNTGDATIIENCTARQYGANLFWGAANIAGKWTGENVLGNLWMMIRSEL